MLHSNALLRATRKSIRDEIYSHQGLQDAITWARGRGAIYFPSGGNLGDGLIGLGTLDLFDHFNFHPEVRVGWQTNVLQGERNLVINCAGGMVEGLWKDFTRVLQPFLEAGGEAVLLPCTVNGYYEFFNRFGKQITIFAREQTTYNHLQGIDSLAGRVHLCHDLAFAVDYDSTGWPEGSSGSDTHLSLLRSDEESGGHSKPRDNIDLALVWNGLQWFDRSVCMPPLTAAAQLIHQFDTVRTDRLHMSVLAALMGKRVTMLSNAYFKNRSVYDYTLHRFKHVQFSDETPSEQPPATVKNVWISWAQSQSERDELKEKLEETNKTLHLAKRRATEVREDLHQTLLELNELRARLMEIARNYDALQQQHSTLARSTDTLELLNEDLHVQIRALRAQLPDPDFRGSRGYRIWLWYLRLYDYPLVGPLLRGMRKIVKPLLIARRRLRGMLR